DSAPAPGLQPPKNHPHDYPGLGPLPGQLPRQLPAITGHHCLSMPPATATCGIPGNHRRDCHISAGLGYHTAHSRHVSAGTTRHPRPTL
ncbi:hypothetical protein C0993_012153, partial [Termitomyces sp. T159_Od127]